MKTNLLSKDKPHADEKKKRTKKILIIIFMCLLMLILYLVYINNLCPDTSIENPCPSASGLDQSGDAINGAASPKSKEEILNDLEKQQLVVTDKLSSNITFPAGNSGTSGDWIVENPSSNNIIQQAEVYWNDVLIAKSSPIYPNQHITGVELLVDVESGEYEAIAYLNYYDIETKEFVSKAGYAIHLTIK